MADTMIQGGTKPAGFSCLPLEIREEIYCHLFLGRAVFVGKLHFEADSWVRPMLENPERRAYFIPTRKASILSVSRQISEEALNVLYGRNLFVVLISDGAHNKLASFGVTNVQRIRHLVLVAEPEGVCFPKPMQFDSQLWIPLLADLKRLCLVAKQPIFKGLPVCPPEHIRQWIAWLEPILQYLAQNVAEKTTVGVDYNNLVETGDVIQKCFRTGYVRVQTMTGDRLFTRGSYWEFYEDDPF